MSDHTPQTFTSESVYALQETIHGLCERGEGVHIPSVMNIYAGMVSECLLEFSDPHEEAAFFLKRLKHALLLCFERSQVSTVSFFHDPLMLDNDVDVGRTLSRIYLSDDILLAQTTVKHIEALVCQFVQNVHGNDHNAMIETVGYFSHVLEYAILSEVIAHDFCNVVIEELISRKAWSLSDTISGLAALSGHYLQKHQNSDKDTALDIEALMILMAQEAARHGVSAGNSLLTGMVANDCPLRPQSNKVSLLLPLSATLCCDFNIACPEIASALFAKAAGRMIAVASTGDAPEIEPVVSRPLAFSAMSSAYLYTTHA